MVVGEQDEIRLELPATGPYARIARVAASSLALRLRLPRALIEDLRLAVDEAAVLLLSAAAEGDSILARYLVGDDEIEIDLRLLPGDRGLPPVAVERFERIAADLETRHAVRAPEGAVTLTLGRR